MKTILIVDDVADNIKLLKDLLTAENYKIKVANSGIKALELINKSEQLPDLILLDIMMPEMSGYEVCQALKQNPNTSDIPVIFVTAKGEIEDETYGFEVGAVDYINKPVSAPLVKARVKTHLELKSATAFNKLAEKSIQMLGHAGHYNDDDTGHHIWRMAEFSKAIAKKLGYSPNDLNSLRLAASMHDTGKIGIRDSVLKAPRKLDPEEWKHMQTHSQIGHDILIQGEHEIFKLSASIAKYHHEKFDGSGYPEGLKDHDIPIEARIVAVADVFDALTTKRPYKEPWSVEDAIDEIKMQSGKHFDPQVVDAFLSIQDEILEIKQRFKE